jgi:hypothetical protein
MNRLLYLPQLMLTQRDGRNELILQHNHEGWNTELAACAGK